MVTHNTICTLTHTHTYQLISASVIESCASYFFTINKSGPERRATSTRQTKHTKSKRKSVHTNSDVKRAIVKG